MDIDALETAPRRNQRGPKKTGLGGLVEPRPRIAIVDLDTGFSGITRYVISLLEGMADTEFELLLVCRPVAPYPPIPGVRVIYVGDPPPAAGEPARGPCKARAFVRVRDATKWLWRR